MQGHKQQPCHHEYLVIRSWPLGPEHPVHDPVAWRRSFPSLGLCLPIYKTGRGLEGGRQSGERSFFKSRGSPDQRGGLGMAQW